MSRKIDLAGQRFGRLVAVREDGRSAAGTARWACICDCGATITTDGRHLRIGHTRSCGCLARELTGARSSARMRGRPALTRVDMAGRRFGRWLVLAIAGAVGDMHAMWLCRCDCGVERVVRGNRLRRGQSQSCGCLHRERASVRQRGRTGPLNASWKGDRAGDSALHLRVVVARGRPRRCEHCGWDDPETRYEWANVSGNYGNVWDFARLCVPCHRLFDAQKALRARALGRRT